MTHCPSQAQLAQFLDERIDVDDRDPIGRHVDNCQPCQATLDQLTKKSTNASLPTSDKSFVPQTPALAAVLDQAKQAHAVEIGCGQEETGDALVASQVVFPGAPNDQAPLGQLEEYEILEHIGSGAGGDVFRARDSRLGRFVAIKVLKQQLAFNESALARFAREARAVGGLDNDNIVTLYAFAHRPDFPPYLVFEFVDGDTLGDLIRRETTAPPDEAARIIGEAAEALATAHDAGIVHRDIKPSNIMVERPSGRVKVADFGLALCESQETAITVEGTLAGTPDYMSPEQVQGLTVVDGRSDIYSLGVLLYEMLTGSVPYRGTLRMILHQRLHEDPERPRRLNDAIPRDLEIICLKAMSRERGHRYQSASEFAADLRRWRSGQPVLARPVGTGERVWRWSRRNPVVAGMTTLVSLMLVGGLVGGALFTLWLADARDASVQAEQNANDSARLMTLQRDLAVDALRSMIYETQNELADEPRLQQLRERLLEIASNGLEEVNALGHVSEQGELGSAIALSRLGDLARERGHLEAAGEHYAQAVERLRLLTKLHPLSVDVSTAMALILCNQGDLDEARGDLTMAESRYREAVKLCQRTDLGQTATVSALGGLRVASDRLGDLCRRSQRFEEAASYYQQVIASMTPHTPNEQANPTMRRDMAVALQKLGLVKLEIQRFDQAASDLEQGHAIFTDLSQQDAAACSCQRDLAISFSRLAEMKRQQAEHVAARNFLRKGELILQELIKQDSESTDDQRHLAAMKSTRGEVSIELGDFKEAGKCLEDSIRLYGTLVEGDSPLAKDEQELQRCRDNLGILRRMTGANSSSLESSGFSHHRELFPDLTPPGRSRQLCLTGSTEALSSVSKISERQER